MIRRTIALLILITAVAGIVFVARIAICAASEPKLSETTKETAIAQPIAVLRVSKEKTDEPKEKAVEEMLASGILTDEIALDYDLQLTAREAAKTFDVPYKLLLAVMFRESSYNPDAHNDICYGLMQIHQINFDSLEEELAEYGVTDIKNNPEDNIYAGAYMLGNLIGKYEDYHKALMVYNCGENGAKRLWEQGYTSTQYSRDICDMMETLTVAENITER